MQQDKKREETKTIDEVSRSIKAHRASIRSRDRNSENRGEKRAVMEQYGGVGWLEME